MACIGLGMGGAGPWANAGVCFSGSEAQYVFTYYYMEYCSYNTVVILAV